LLWVLPVIFVGVGDVSEALFDLLGAHIEEELAVAVVEGSGPAVFGRGVVIAFPFLDEDFAGLAGELFQGDVVGRRLAEDEINEVARAGGVEEGGWIDALVAVLEDPGFDVFAGDLAGDLPGRLGRTR